MEAKADGKYKGLFFIDFEVDQQCVFLICGHCGTPLRGVKDSNDESVIHIQRCPACIDVQQCKNILNKMGEKL
jgi:hypothetical protein